MSTAPHYGLIGGAPSDASAETLRALEGYNRGHRKNPVVACASDMWAVGCAETAEGPVDYPVSWTDIESDEAWAKEMLDLAGVGRGDFAFFSYIYSRSAHTWPWLKMGFERGARLATGMPTQWDAYRLEMYCRLFAVKLVFGLTPEALDGLEGAGHRLSEVFGKVERIIAVGEAWRRLREAGLAPWKLHWLGPIVAIDPCDGAGARFDYKQWTLEGDGGRLTISNALPRACAFTRTPLAAKGRIGVADGEPRLFMEE
ncbi:MAG: hypothetical protein HXY28_00330 [Hydrogenophilaceae bacterium]|jgi:hypothetical protein|nr:hypothetical protein [Hydrogenophilaceae bacterium]